MPRTLPTTLPELRQEAGRLGHEIDKIKDAAKTEARSFTAEENTKLDELLEHVDAVRAAIGPLERQATLDRRLDDLDQWLGQSRGRQTDDTAPGRPTPPAAETRGGYAADRELRIDIRGVEHQFRAGSLAHLTANPEYRAAFNAMLCTEPTALDPAFAKALGVTRDLQTNTTTKGGSWAPIQFVAQLIADLDNTIPLRQYASVWTVTDAGGLGFPTVEADPDDPDWTTEVGSVSADTTARTGLREFRPHLLTKLVKESMQLLNSTPLNAESWVRQRLAYKMGVAQENAFMTGTGAGQPLGIFTASAMGISTGRDVATGNSSTAIGAANLFEQVYNLTSPYRMNGRWLLSRTAVKQIRKLTDSVDGRYLWQDGIAAGQPSTLLGYPVTESEYCPATFTSGLYVGAFGDLSKYYIADAALNSVQRLNELYAGNNQVGFICRSWTDGMPVDENAFSRMKLG